MNTKLGLSCFFFLFSCVSYRYNERSGIGTVPPISQNDIPHFFTDAHPGPLIDKKTQASRLKLLWISLDGLKREDLIKYAATLKNPHPFGFRYLLGPNARWSDVRVSDPTITASSHASTISCSPAGEHGILANSQWNGLAMESGFDTPYTAETFIHALRKAGLKVGVAGYPGIDGKTPNRTADAATNNRSSALLPQFVNLVPGKREEFFILSEVKTGAAYPAAVTWNTDGAGEAKIDLGASGVHILGPDQWLNIFFREKDSLQTVALRLLRPKSAPSAQGRFPVLYVSAPSLNSAHPADFRQELENSHLVFSPGKNFQVQKEYGPEEFMKTFLHRLDYFESVDHLLMTKNEFDALFLYFEDLDVLGHSFSGQPEADGLRSQHFAVFDQVMGGLLARVPAAAGVLLVGDHGMTTIDYEVSSQALLPPKLSQHFMVKASGGSVFLYGKNPEDLKTPPPTDEPWFREAVGHLRNFPLPADPSQGLFQQVVVRGDALSVSSGWNSQTRLPWVAAYARPRVSIKETVEPGPIVSLRKGFDLPSALPLPLPEPPGQHGHFSGSSDMLTSLVTFGRPFLGANSFGPGPVSNLTLVPIVADLMKWPRPEFCKNKVFNNE